MPGHKRFTAQVAAPARLTASRPGVAQTEAVEEAAETTSEMGSEVEFTKVKDNPATLKSPITPQNILRLQHTLGNQAVQRLIAGKSQTAKPVSAHSVQSAQPIQRMRFDLLPAKSMELSDAIARRGVAPGNKGRSKIIMFKVDRKLHFSVVYMGQPQFNEFHVTIVTEIEADGARTLVPLHYFFREGPAGVWQYRDSSDEKANLEQPALFQAKLDKAKIEGAKFAAALNKLNNPAAAAAAGKAADNGPSAAAAAAKAAHSPAAGAAGAGGGAVGYYNPPSASAALHGPIQPSPAPMGTYSPPPANGPAAPMAASNSSSATATATATAAPALEPATPVVDVSPDAIAAAAAAASTASSGGSATAESISSEAPAPAPVQSANIAAIVSASLAEQDANPNQLISPAAASTALAATTLPRNVAAAAENQLAHAHLQLAAANPGNAAAPAQSKSTRLQTVLIIVTFLMVAMAVAYKNKDTLGKFLIDLIAKLSEDS